MVRARPADSSAGLAHSWRPAQRETVAQVEGRRRAERLRVAIPHLITAQFRRAHETGERDARIARDARTEARGATGRGADREPDLLARDAAQSVAERKAETASNL